MNTPNTNPAPDMAVERENFEQVCATRLKWNINSIKALRGLDGNYPHDRDLGLMWLGFMTGRAALARPQEVAGWVMEEDIIRLEGVAETLARAGEKIVPMYASRAPVAVGVEPVQIGEGFFLPDGKWSGSASRTLGYLGMVEDDKANGCTIRPIYAFPAGAGGSVGAEPAYDGVHGHPEFGALQAQDAAPVEPTATQFIAYLIDNCEGHAVAEEALQGWLVACIDALPKVAAGVQGDAARWKWLCDSGETATGKYVVMAYLEDDKLTGEVHDYDAVADAAVAHQSTKGA